MACEHQARHIATHDPARVLATCAAHRAIVEYAGDTMGAHENPATGDYRHGQADAAQVALRALATVYADRPGYDKGWAL